jgi:hypothetical protein
MDHARITLILRHLSLLILMRGTKTRGGEGRLWRLFLWEMFESRQTRIHQRFKKKR